MSTGSNNHFRVNTVYYIGVSSFTNANDISIFDPNICLEDTILVHNSGIYDYYVQRLQIRGPADLTYPISQRLSASKSAFISISSEIILDFDPKISRSKSDQVTRSRAVLNDIFFSCQFTVPC